AAAGGGMIAAARARGGNGSDQKTRGTNDKAENQQTCLSAACLRLLDRFATGAGGEGGHNGISRVGEKADRSVAEQECGASGVEAPEMKQVALLGDLAG